MLAKPWFIFSEVLHVFSLAISTKVWEENLFRFVLFHFTSSKNQKKIFQDVGTRSFDIFLDTS